MTFTKLLDTNYFSRWEAQVFYNSVYLPSITYPLPMNPLSQQQCREMNSRLFQCLLPRLGYNRHTATALRYAPRNIGGIGLKHLYHEQGGLLLQHIYKHLNSPQTTVGRMLRIALSWTQAFLGTSRLILTDVHDTLPPIGPSIFIDLRQFLQQIDAKILLHDFPKPLVLRQRDRFIMDIATGQASWSSRQLQQINASRHIPWQTSVIRLEQDCFPTLSTELHLPTQQRSELPCLTSAPLDQWHGKHGVDLRQRSAQPKDFCILHWAPGLSITPRQDIGPLT